MKMKIFIILLLLTSSAFAQQTVITKPFGVTTTNSSGTITTTNNFQTVLNAGGRSACTVQNHVSNSHSMWVFFGPATSATKLSSVELGPGQYVGCISGSVVLKDEVAITGTSGDSFYAGQQ